MDIVTIITVIAGIAAILGFVYIVLIGQQSIIEWWRHIRGHKPVRQSPPVIIIPVVESEEALVSRRSHTQRYRQYIERQGNSTIRELLQPIIDEGKITDPAVPLPPDSDFVDCICGVVTREGKAIAVLPSGYSTPDIEGVGRSSLILRLFGITIPYGRLLGMNNSALKSLGSNIPIFRQPDVGYRLLATDIAYIGSSAGKLSIIPTKGEMVSFIWDLARNIFRSIELEYQTGDHRKTPGREKLDEIFYHIPFSEFRDIFGKLDTMYYLNEIIILRRRIEAYPLPSTRRILTGDERKQQLLEAMLVSLKHGSVFWKRDTQTLTYRVNSILNKLDWNKMCPIVELTISHPNLIIPYYVFDEVAELIQKGKLSEKQQGSASVNMGSGIRYHNDTLIRSVHDVNEIQILVTSGEHLFKDTFFWKTLSQVRKEFNLQVLLLDPDSPAIAERQKSAYADKVEEFLRKEIQENIDTIKRMFTYFKEKGNQVHIQCNLYSELFPFRMTFIGTQRLLIASYLKGKRTGFDTIFYDLHADQESDLFYGFKEIYERIKSTARPISLSV